MTCPRLRTDPWYADPPSLHFSLQNTTSLSDSLTERDNSQPDLVLPLPFLIKHKQATETQEPHKRRVAQLPVVVAGARAHEVM